MVKDRTCILLACLLFFVVNPLWAEEVLLGKMGGGRQLVFQKERQGWVVGINDGQALLEQVFPLQVELYKDGKTDSLRGLYTKVKQDGAIFVAEGLLNYQNVVFRITDSYMLDNGTVTLDRTMQVDGNWSGGFGSSFGFCLKEPQERNAIRYFAPGNMYGNTVNLPENAFGKDLGLDHLLIREDRLPAPLFGACLPGCTTISLLNVKPDGRTSWKDARTTMPCTFIDEAVKVGSLGAQYQDGKLWIGYCFPLAEGDITYSDRTHAAGWINREKAWSKRYHPVKDGFVQHYTVAFRIDKNETFQDFYVQAWRWAWNLFRPQVEKHDIEAVKHYSVKVLSDAIVQSGNCYGIPNAIHLRVDKQPDYQQTIVGFTGKALETAYYFLRYAESAPSDSAGYRRQALGLFQTFTKLTLNPPEAEGFELKTWKPANALSGDCVYLRSYTDDLKATLRAYLFERSKGRLHPEWLTWVRNFTDWLLTKQNAEGGFPRTFVPRTGEVLNPSAQGSYLVVPLLVLLAEATGNAHYLQVALQVGDYCWKLQKEGEFTGGTIDNPNAVDKEAGSLSLEGYLMLYRKTKDIKWLKRARSAADYTETWMYIWNVPMPADVSQDELNWKIGTSTVGLQLISTGHSLADYYCCFDADEFAGLAEITNDEHYRSVSNILLHNTCNMIYLPDNKVDHLPAYGFQEEHWSVAPVRGVSNTSLWLPWVSTSHLNGIYGLEDLQEEQE